MSDSDQDQRLQRDHSSSPPKSSAALPTSVFPGRDAIDRPPSNRPRPRFAFELEEFAMDLPPGKEIGRCIAVARDPRNGDLWLLNFSHYGPFTPATVEARLPWATRLSAEGKYLGGFDKDSAPVIDGVTQWPDDPDNIEVDAEGNVYIVGWSRNDTAILKYSPEGKFLRQYGRRCNPAESDDSTDTRLRGPASVYHDVSQRQLIVADGYGGHRIVVLNSDTGEYIQSWGADGRKPPSSVPEEERYQVPIHKVLMSPDGLLYAADRKANRVQEFQIAGNDVRYLREVSVGPGVMGMGSCFDIAFTPDNKYMYVADGMSMRVWTVDRESFEVLGWTTAAPEHEGDFNIGANRTPLHRFALLPSGDLLIGRGRKGIQRMKYLGVK